jgi:transposase
MLAVLADRQQETVVAFRRAMPEALRRTRARACMAMDAGVVRALDEDGPWAAIVSARFHGARAYCDGADTGRKPALQRLTSALPTVESADIHGTMWPFHQRPVALEPPAWRARVFTDAPTLAAADHLREDLTALGARDDTKAGATCAMRAWSTRVRASGLVECNSVLGTRERWMDAITHDFHDRQTSGVVEGFNTRVNVLKRRCDGIFTVGSLFQRLTLDLHGDQRFGHI